MKKTVAIALSWLALAGCSSPPDLDKDGIVDGVREPNNVSVVAPSTPKGTVSGQVLTTRLQPLQGAKVAMTIGSSRETREEQTSAEGNFTFQDVPAGAEVLLTISKAEFATLRATSFVPSAAGNIPINNANASFGPITLAELNGTLRFSLVTPSGRPAVNARATLEALPTGAVLLYNQNEASPVVSSVTVSAATNDQGIVTFSNVPSPAELDRIGGYVAGGGRYKLWVDPVDSNNDGIPETGGYVGTLSAAEALTNTLRVIRLPYAQSSSEPFTVISSNLARLHDPLDYSPLRNMVRMSDSAIHITFNHPLQNGSVLVLLTDEYGRSLLPVTTMVGGLDNSLTVLPGNAVTYQEGREYNLHVRAVSAQTGELLLRSAAFFFGEPASPKPLELESIAYQETSTSSTQRLDRGEVVYVHLNQAVEARSLGVPSGALATVFIDADIDGFNGIGNVAGELGNAQGLLLFACEPVTHLPAYTPPGTTPNLPSKAFPPPVFPFEASGYTTRFCFTYSGSVSLPPATRMYARFETVRTSTPYLYETLWGTPISRDFSAQVSVMPVPPP